MTPYKPFVLDAIGEVDSRSEKTIDTLRPSHGSRLWGASLSAANCVLTSFANGDSAHYPVTPSPAGPYDSQSQIQIIKGPLLILLEIWPL